MFRSTLRFVVSVVVVLAFMMLTGALAYSAGVDTSKSNEVSFKKDVTPIIHKYCLPCHAEDNYNPSELSMDTYDQLMTGGKHGSPVVAGKSAESNIVKKLRPDPPFGKSMPLKKRSQPEQQWVPDDLQKVIVDWIDQGAKNN